MPGKGVPVPALREERVRNALTQDELAERSGVARSTIARLETGDHGAISTVRRLARALQVDPALLMGMEPPAPLQRVAESRARYRTGGRSQPPAGGAMRPAGPQKLTPPEPAKTEAASLPVRRGSAGTGGGVYTEGTEGGARTGVISAIDATCREAGAGQNGPTVAPPP